MSRCAPLVLAVPAVLGLLALSSAGCSRDGRSSVSGAPADTAKAPAPRADCGHAVCGSNFFIDTSTAGDCAVGAACAVTLKLTATGEFHINQDYPYKFRADDAAGLEFLGTDMAGKATFSKAAANWQTADEKSGVMTVAFRPSTGGAKAVAGTFKLSVCSAQSCQLEQSQVSTAVAVR